MAETPSFGIFHQAWGTADQDDAACVREVVEATVLAERLGFDVAWFTEQHARMFERWWGRLPEPHLLVAHVAARTDRILLGTAVKLLPFAEPVQVAEEMLLLDVLTGNRSLHGVGAGVAPGPDGRPVDRAERRKCFRARLAALLAILRGEPGAAPYALPLQPHDLSARMSVAATDPESVALAAREGLGYLVGMFGGPRHGELVRRFRVGGGTGPARAARMVYVGADDRAARADVRDAARYFYEHFTPPVPSWREAMRAAGPPVDLDDLLRRVGWIAGGPATVARALERYAADARLDGIDLTFHVPGLPPELARVAMERFATQVRPLVRPLAPA